MRYGIFCVVYVIKVLGFFILLLTFTHLLIKIRDWYNLQPDLQWFEDHKRHYGPYKCLFIFKLRYGLQLYYAHDYWVLLLLPSLPQWPNTTGRYISWRLIFIVVRLTIKIWNAERKYPAWTPCSTFLKTRFLMIAEIDGNANKDWRFPI